MLLASRPDVMMLNFQSAMNFSNAKVGKKKAEKIEKQKEKEGREGEAGTFDLGPIEKSMQASIE